MVSSGRTSGIHARTRACAHARAYARMRCTHTRSARTHARLSARPPASQPAHTHAVTQSCTLARARTSAHACSSLRARPQEFRRLRSERRSDVWHSPGVSNRAVPVRRVLEHACELDRSGGQGGLPEGLRDLAPLPLISLQSACDDVRTVLEHTAALRVQARRA